MEEGSDVYNNLQREIEFLKDELRAASGARRAAMSTVESVVTFATSEYDPLVEHLKGLEVKVPKKEKSKKEKSAKVKPKKSNGQLTGEISMDVHVWENIIQLLDFRSLCAIHLVCKRLNAIANSQVSLNALYEQARIYFVKKRREKWAEHFEAFMKRSSFGWGHPPAGGLVFWPVFIPQMIKAAFKDNGEEKMIAKIAQEVDAELKKMPRWDYDIIVTGPTASGKTSFIRRSCQIDLDLESFHTKIELYTVKSMQTLLQHAHLIPSEELSIKSLDDVTLAKIPSLWENEIVKKAYSDGMSTKDLSLRQNIGENASHFFSLASVLLADKYSVTQEDLQKFYEKSENITYFSTALSARITELELDCFFNLRKHWFSLIDHTLLIICIPLSNCAEFMKYREKFKDIMNAESSVIGTWAFNKAIPKPLVVFTKVDIFEENIKSGKERLSDYFPEYQGEDDVSKAKEFILQKTTTELLLAPDSCDVAFVNNLTQQEDNYILNFKFAQKFTSFYGTF